ncbi:MAG: DUF262 domain-containing protein [Sulfurovum sp.]|nr:DUF262 domain-containing protein [Sulfurovum sp.]MCB4765518.1 DUF262 domain-containing protein [Sulfurovum sp.]MCB4766147.1 DUF262 domain-containing protein [Sulfurovum sp.]
MTIIDGEHFILEDDDSSVISMTDDEINAKYKRGEIRIVTEQARYPIKSIKDMLESGDYKLNPEYQRRKRWDNTRKSRLIESFIMNVPLPPIFLYEYTYAKYEVMDGLQRLSSIHDFYTDVFPLEGLEYWKELNGKRYSELPSEIKTGIDRRYISSIVLLEETAKTEEEAEELKQIVFERLNSGGEKLTPQETRNALYNGKFNTLCIKLSSTKIFKEMWDIPSDEEELLTHDMYKKMQDVELVLRFFAYRHLAQIKNYPIAYFLDEYLKQANLFPDKTIQELEKKFLSTLETAHAIFGDTAFHLPSYGRQVHKSSKTVYDSLMQSLHKHLDSKDILITNRDKIIEQRYAITEDLIAENGKKLFDGKYGGWSHIDKRIKYFDKLFKQNITN